MLSEEEMKMSSEARALRRENNELEKQLNCEMNDALTDIVVYIRNANISDLEQEKVRRDITQMLIDGQNRGYGAPRVIGGDYKAFCNEIIGEIPQISAKQRILTAVRDTLPALCVLFGIWAAFAALTRAIKGEAWYITPLYAADVLMGAALLLAATLTVVYITKNSFSANGYVLVCLLLLIVAIAAAGTLLLPKVLLFRPHIAADAALLLLLYAAYRIIDSRV